jgi:hypothetical protein
MSTRVKSVVAVSVILIGSLAAANSAQAQYVPPYWIAASVPPPSGGWHATAYPYSWPWYGSYARSYGWHPGYRFNGYVYHRGYTYHYGYGHYRSGHFVHRSGYVGRR